MTSSWLRLDSIYRYIRNRHLKSWWIYCFTTSGVANSKKYQNKKTLGKIVKILMKPALHLIHYNDVIMTTIASQITSLTVVYSTVYSDADQRNHQSSASLAFVRGIHRDRWIPRTKGQLRGKCFHLMTSSCYNNKWWHQWPLLLTWFNFNPSMDK